MKGTSHGDCSNDAHGGAVAACPERPAPRNASDAWKGVLLDERCGTYYRHTTPDCGEPFSSSLRAYARNPGRGRPGLHETCLRRCDITPAGFNPIQSLPQRTG